MIETIINTPKVLTDNAFMKMLKEDAESPEEIELIEEYAKKIGGM